MADGFRETTPKDYPAVAEFLQRIFNFSDGDHPPLTSPDMLWWKCWDKHPYWKGSRGYILTKEQTITAYAAVVPLSYVAMHRRMRVVHIIDWAADPRWIGSGLALIGRIMGRTDAIISIGNNKLSRSLFSTFGSTAHGTAKQFARPLHPLRRLPGSRPSLRLAAQFSRSCLWRLGAPAPQAPGWKVRRVAPEQLRTWNPPWPRAAPDSAFFRRTADLAKYLLRCPGARMELYSASRPEGSERGYFLLTHTAGQVRIVDFHVSPQKTDNWQSILFLAIAVAEDDADAAEIVSVSSNADTCAAMTACGFHERGALPVHFLTTKSVNIPDIPLRIRMIDNDSAYRDAEHRNYWT